MIIKFKTREIMISIILCLSGLAFSVFVLLTTYLSVRLIFILWIVVIGLILLERVAQLRISRKGIAALKLDEYGVTNHTVLKEIFIPWDEINDFQAGFYRTRSIFIDVKTPVKYRTTKIEDYRSLIGYLHNLTTTKSDLLWIDTDLLNIKKEDLLSLLKMKLREQKSKGPDN